MRKLSTSIFGLLLLVSGCHERTPLTRDLESNPPVTASGVTTAPIVVPSVSVLPQVPTNFSFDFEIQPIGTLPEEFIDVATEATLPKWVYSGKWSVVADEKGNHVLMHQDVREQPAVSFVRYRGSTLGRPDGVLPERYFAQVTMRPLSSPYNYPPTGDQGVQFYYLSYNQYVEVVVKPGALEAWECNCGEPRSSKGWRKLWGEPLQTQAGDRRQVGALVDKVEGTFSIYLEGTFRASVHSDLISEQSNWLALRGIGNVVSFDDLLVEQR